jgi:hypothetical protein
MLSRAVRADDPVATSKAGCVGSASRSLTEFLI